LATHQKPITGDWYINTDGQFIGAWGAVYEYGQLGRIIIQQHNGKRYHVSLSDWYQLDLVPCPISEEQRNGTLPS